MIIIKICLLYISSLRKRNNVWNLLNKQSCVLPSFLSLITFYWSLQKGMCHVILRYLGTFLVNREFKTRKWFCGIPLLIKLLFHHTHDCEQKRALSRWFAINMKNVGPTFFSLRLFIYPNAIRFSLFHWSPSCFLFLLLYFFYVVQLVQVVIAMFRSASLGILGVMWDYIILKPTVCSNCENTAEEPSINPSRPYHQLSVFLNQQVQSRSVTYARR